eukprot:TRINITY_DN9458_c0_g1_i1.p1 TRINITY_DN9458_c0_g1~~TRINITY_DN9458_c0_g1_i1.p1  ORF type:complete len:670 (+),score=188.07 TRINITY_DN9458_c0_g1_i1:1967-3976(+)
MTSYLEAQVRGIQAKDKEITSDLTKLAYEVHSTQRRARKNKDKPVASSVRHDAEETGYLRKLEQMRGSYEAAAAERIENMKKNWQQEYCKLEDQHFQTIRKLEEEVHRLRKAVHISDTELSVVTQNFSDLKKAHIQLKEQAPDISMLKHTIDVKVSVIQGLEHKVEESEAQIIKLRKSLEDAIEAIQRQHKENTELLRRLEHHGPRDGRLELENEIWNFGHIIGAPLDSNFDTVVSLVGEALKELPKNKKLVKETDELCAKLTLKLKNLEDQAARAAGSTDQQSQLLEQIKALQQQNEALAQAKECAESQLSTEGDLISQISTLKLENAALASERAAASELKMKISAMESQLISQISALKVNATQSQLDESSLLSENDLTDLRVKIATLENAAVHQEAKESKLLSRISDLEETNDSLMEAKAHLEAEVRTKEAAVKESESQVTGLKASNAALISQLDGSSESSERLQQADKLLGELRDKISAMNAAAAKYNERESELTAQVDALEKACDIEKARAQSMHNELEDLRERLADEEAHRTSLEDELQVFKGVATSGLEGRVKELEGDRLTLEAQVKALQEENDTLHKKMSKATSDVEEQAAVLEELQALKTHTPVLASQLADTTASAEEMTSACMQVTQLYHKRLLQLQKVALMYKDLKQAPRGAGAENTVC